MPRALRHIDDAAQRKNKNRRGVPGDDGVDASAERELVRAPFIINAESSAEREKGIASPIHDLLSVRSSGAARCTFSSIIPAILAPLIAAQKNWMAARRRTVRVPPYRSRLQRVTMARTAGIRKKCDSRRKIGKLVGNWRPP